MSPTLRIAAVQAPPLPAGAALDAFAADVRQILADDPSIQCLAYPELHLFGVDGTPEEQDQRLRATAETLDGPIVAGLKEIARDAGVWLIPGSICEKGDGDDYYNTVLAFSPDGELVASYRKVFVWRPHEFFALGDRFVVFDIPGAGRVGLSNCYDAWFPEVTRHLAWMGADVVVNVVMTTTPDRPQELVLAQANSIVNQTFTVSVNRAGPVGMGGSLIVGPEGAVLEQDLSANRAVLAHALDLGEVSRVRETGTMGTNRMWSQFTEADAPLELPLYDGRIAPERWQITPPA
ncbi:MAG: carbon-nitrogen hydrolase family protein [Homoserinimonas sp.]